MSEMNDPWNAANAIVEDLKLRADAEREIKRLLDAGWRDDGATSRGSKRLSCELVGSDIEVTAEYRTLNQDFQVNIWTTRMYSLNFKTANDVMMWRLDVERHFSRITEQTQSKP